VVNLHTELFEQKTHPLKTEKKVQSLTYLGIQLFEKQLMLIEAKGVSEHEKPGIPKLVPVNKPGSNLEDGILELDFIIQPVDTEIKQSVRFEIKTVFEIGILQEELKGIKVNAAENADIALLTV
jgi:hypothetical protein